jgi:Ser/Thr protein kinase RdoA (MazF antagonist)
MVLEAEKRVPLRITHNDTKCNNILFDDQDHALCVVDLDTVMPGKVWYDTGDSLRTLISNSEEDERDLEKVRINPDRFERYMEGYLEMTHHLLTENEMQSLPLSPGLMAFLMGVRFLTDHLSGDVYYKTDYRGHNLIRAKAQLKLADEVIKHEKVLKERLQEVLKRIRGK